jgi:hypothetical protein
MKKDKNMDDLFREKLMNYEKDPPAYLLENILDRVAQTRRKKKIIILRIVGIAAALAIAFITGLELNHSIQTNIRTNVVSNSRNKKPYMTDENVRKINGSSNNKPGTENQKRTIYPDIQNGNTSVNKASTPEKRTPSDRKKDDSTTEKAEKIDPLKSLYAFLGKNPTATLQQKKNIQSRKNRVEKSVDQQIIELNEQMLTIQNKTREKKQWLVGAQVSPEYYGTRTSHSETYSSSMLQSGSDKVDLSGGLTLELKKNKRWSIQSGIYYSRLGQSIGGSSEENSYTATNSTYKYNATNNTFTTNSAAGVIELTKILPEIVYAASLDNSTLSSVAYSSANNKYTQDFDYLEIPLYLRYNLIDSKLKVFMLGGISSNILVGNRVYAEGSSGKTVVGKTKDLETMNYSGTIGIGLRYELSHRISINMEPRLKYFLNSLSNNSSISYKPYSVGIFTGLNYEF